MGSILDQSTIRQVTSLLPEGMLSFAESILTADAGSLCHLPAPGQRPGGVWAHADELVGDPEKQSLRGLLPDGAKSYAKPIKRAFRGP